MNEWVEKKIAEHNISLRELGRQSGLDHSTISKVLNDKQKPGNDYISDKIAHTKQNHLPYEGVTPPNPVRSAPNLPL